MEQGEGVHLQLDDMAATLERLDRRLGALVLESERQRAARDAAQPSPGSAATAARQAIAAAASALDGAARAIDRWADCAQPLEDGLGGEVQSAQDTLQEVLRDARAGGRALKPSNWRCGSKALGRPLQQGSTH